MADSPSSPLKGNLPVLYYGVIVVGTVAVVLAIYNLIIIRWCASHRRRLRDINQQLDSRRRMSSSSSSMRGLNSFNLGESFKYKKGDDDSIQLGYGINECPVCLCFFEQDEQVRELPRCKHSFHAPCIEMWLYSHLDCPLCRALVQFPVSPRNSITNPTMEHSTESPRNSITDPTLEHSPEVLIDPRLHI
ncbi:RING-H2 finger protein ATL52-like [Apium graveolens]|uniref:RING-H2 finger protein ATL52-like n=1 Tax=Apium graveolens TaxID=4045 RepID=UPI003D7A9F9F